MEWYELKWGRFLVCMECIWSNICHTDLRCWKTSASRVQIVDIVGLVSMKANLRFTNPDIQYRSDPVTTASGEDFLSEFFVEKLTLTNPVAQS